jgi:hypothetical protein
LAPTFSFPEQSTSTPRRGRKEHDGAIARILRGNARSGSSYLPLLHSERRRRETLLRLLSSSFLEIVLNDVLCK